MENFDTYYARFYDLIYKDKDYAKEALFIERLLRAYVTVNLEESIGLDLACGTGKHIFELEKSGLRLDGSDISKSMIAIAKARAKENGSKAEFYNYAFQQCGKIPKRYDYVLSMFSAIDYLTADEDLHQTLNNIHALLKKDGIFLFDCWNERAVLRDYSPYKELHKQDGTSEITRISNTVIDENKRIATVNFDCKYIENGILQKSFNEVHPMRYFGIDEMKALLSKFGFEVLALRGFMKPDIVPDPYEWNVTYIARRI